MKRSPDKRDFQKVAVDRRTLLIGGGAAAGLLHRVGALAAQLSPNLAVGENETLINAFLKIDTAGQIIVVVPQLEMGQGITTVLPQILADELGADWRTVAVQGAPVSPLYANQLLAREFMEDGWATVAGDWAMREYATCHAMMLTGGATALRKFGDSYRTAGAAARVLLCKAAAARWDVEWESCDIVGGLVTDGRRTLRIGELAAEAAELHPARCAAGAPEGREDRLIGQDVPRLDLPSKVDGTLNYAADIRLPDMVFASIRQGPVGAVRLESVKEAAAKKVPGFVRLVRQDAGSRRSPPTGGRRTRRSTRSIRCSSLTESRSILAPSTRRCARRSPGMRAAGSTRWAILPPASRARAYCAPTMTSPRRCIWRSRHPAPPRALPTVAREDLGGEPRRPPSAAPPWPRRWG